MIIKKTLLTFIFTSLISSGLFAAPTEVKWKTFSQYNLKTKTVGKDLKKVLNKNISIIGFMIPLDYSKKTIKEFLLVPYYPSCAHVPPPPPNQILKVQMSGKSGIKPSYFPVKVTGVTKLVKANKKKGTPIGESEGQMMYMPEGVFSMKASKIKEMK
ncbi:MAG: DUF3299 domain-containing protein [Oligoflexia bacterium]|nr:DUF3299 domain-containing protein [Oligoflexia bacterium]